MNNYDLNLFKIFYYVAKYKSFTKAAECLFITQPAISQSIKKLEEQLNVELFKRKNKGVELTEAGEVVYHYSEQLYSLVSSNNNLINKLNSINAKEIKIGVTTHNSFYFSGDNITNFLKKYKNIKIQFISNEPDYLMKLLEKREIDIVIGSNINTELKTITIDTLRNIESCFVCGKDFKVEKYTMSLNELNNYPLILPTKNTNDRKMLDLIAKKYNIDKYNTIVECDSSTICKRLVVSNLGISWLKKDIFKRSLENGEIIELKIETDSITMPLSIAYNKDFISEPLEYLIELFKETSLL